MPIRQTNPMPIGFDWMSMGIPCCDVVLMLLGKQWSCGRKKGGEFYARLVLSLALQKNISPWAQRPCPFFSVPVIGNPMGAHCQNCLHQGNIPPPQTAWCWSTHSGENPHCTLSRRVGGSVGDHANSLPSHASAWGSVVVPCHSHADGGAYCFIVSSSWNICIAVGTAALSICLLGKFI